MLIEGSKKILLDYGIKIESTTEYPMEAGKIDACVISHAHLDHSGSSPMLFNQGFPSLFATTPTMELTELLVEDSIKIHRRKHEHQRYHKEQLKDMMNRYTPCSYGQKNRVGEYDISLYDAGHICGSAISLIERYKDNKRIAYTGDFKLEPQLLEDGAEVVKCDVLITESTYAHGDHPNRLELVEKFADEVRETIDNGGIALVPVFAVGRAQEMLAVMNKAGLIDHVFIDGMAKAATEIVEMHPEYVKHNELLKTAIQKAMWVESPKNRSHALEGGSIILTTSGMLNGGPVLDYIRRLNKKSKIFLTGYQVEGTNGWRLTRGAPLDIDGMEYKVKQPLSIYDFSAHAGRSDLHKYIKACEPEKVICVHGSPENTVTLAEDLKLEGFDAIAPKVGDKISLGF